MLLFYCTTKKELTTIRKTGLTAGQDGISLWTSWEGIEKNCSRKILVIDGAAVSDVETNPSQPGRVVVSHVPVEAIKNLKPFRQPEHVVAAGGYVIRPSRHEPEVLLIFRRGVWDLPKGKLDEGETVAACALREVREEIGIDELRMLGEAGTTLHDYVEKDQYFVKTTYWFLMHTPETTFTPETKEGIEAAVWKPWSEAVASIGFASLRQHMNQIERNVSEAVSGVR